MGISKKNRRPKTEQAGPQHKRVRRKEKENIYGKQTPRPKSKTARALNNQERDENTQQSGDRQENAQREARRTICPHRKNKQSRTSTR